MGLTRLKLKVKRDVGAAHFVYKGHEGVAPVVFGDKGDSALLGATTLESMELALNPLTRELYPLQMTLMGDVSQWVRGTGRIDFNTATRKGLSRWGSGALLSKVRPRCARPNARAG